MDREQYEEKLRERQRRHLEQVAKNQRHYYQTPGPIDHWKPCMHDSCTSCHGTGVDHRGYACIHAIACDCPRCSPTCVGNTGPVALHNNIYRGDMLDVILGNSSTDTASTTTDNTGGS